MIETLESLEPLKKFFQLHRFDKNVVKLLNSISSPVGIACSGGSDSLCLLLLFKLYWPEKPCILLHYNHRIRSVSDDEEKKMIALAQRLNIPYSIGHRSPNIGTSENALREARYTFFQKALRLYQAQYLLLGHHQDDLFETVLMRLLRGSSLQGLISPRAVHLEKGYIKLRPLLPFSKKEIQAACEACHITYFTDQTNAEDICQRNRVRHYVIPALDTVFGDISWRLGFARSCSILTEQRAYLEKLLSEKFKTIPWEKLAWDRTYLQQFEPYELRYFFQTWFQAHGVQSIRFQHLDELLEAFQTAKAFTINLKKHAYMVCSSQEVKLKIRTPLDLNPFKIKLNIGTVFFSNGYVLTVTPRLFSKELYQKILERQFSHQDTAILDAAILQHNPLVLRSWEPGDCYIPLGHTHEKKVKTLFVDHKIPCEQKSQRPVVCNTSGDILWIPGFPPAEKGKVHVHTKFCVFLIYQKR